MIQKIIAIFAGWGVGLLFSIAIELDIAFLRAALFGRVDQTLTLQYLTMLAGAIITGPIVAGLALRQAAQDQRQPPYQWR
jgi:hypothetical protein